MIDIKGFTYKIKARVRSYTIIVKKNVWCHALYLSDK